MLAQNLLQCPYISRGAGSDGDAQRHNPITGFDTLRQRSGQESEQMKLITAIVNPYKVDDVREAVAGLGVQGMTVTEVKGFGRQRGHAELYRGAEYTVDYRPKVKVEIAVNEDDTERLIEAIVSAARTGKVGDGKIFVTSMDEIVRVRTGETGPTAF
jgi:nitrogen regulatory protein PII